MFTVNVVAPKGETTAFTTWDGLMTYPMPYPGSDYPGIGVMLSLFADCEAHRYEISSMDDFHQGADTLGEKGVLNTKITGSADYVLFKYGTTLRSEAEPTHVYLVKTVSGGTAPIGKIVAYPQPISIKRTVSGPDIGDQQLNTYTNSYTVTGFWEDQSNFRVNWSYNHVVTNKKDNEVLQDVVFTGSVEFRYDSRYKKWMTRSDRESYWKAIATYTTELLTPNFRISGRFSLPLALAYGGPARFLTSERLGDLAQNACNSFKTNDVNMISYCKELPGLPELAIGTIKSIANLDNPKSWADLFLSTKYGWVMSYKDTVDLVKQAECSLTQRGVQQTVGRARLAFQENLGGFKWDCSAAMKIKIGDAPTSPLSQLRKVINSGFWPTAANLWDLVPYSFVVNWLTGVQNIIDALDSNIYADTLPVRTCTYSIKTQTAFDAGLLGTGFLGLLDSTFYQRIVSRSIPIVPLSLGDLSLDKHIVESTALVIQKVLK